MYHTGEGLSLHGEGEQALRGAQDTVGFTPHICKGNHDEGCAIPRRYAHVADEITPRVVD